MILISSKASGEITTEFVIQWIEFLKGKVVRFNGEEMLKDEMSVDISTEEIKTTKNELNDKGKIKVIWFRKYRSIQIIDRESNNLNFLELEIHKNKELRNFYELLIDSYSNAKVISSLSIDHNLNKIKVLRLAKDCGLYIPETVITNNKEKLRLFLLKHFSIVVKPIWNVSFFRKNDQVYKMLTKKISKNDLNKIPKIFAPSLLQEYIEKEYEIRSFFWFKNFYSMAIFSQENEKTVVDFRNYDKVKPNRTVPYKLPRIIEEKTRKLLKLLNIESGSIDFLKTRNEDYIFLEINPNGQFGMVSHPCNYHLEEIVAKKLIELDKL
ncbi:grasp-with-spasm system ATP-grasp peptide maturase [Aquimarina sp. ERC-38]|uniref:grasp-with-spasm system ATP-grasp peptide maturase n=1 Tax=Aquimarina sp. ERC-38 TaxID=2949996 RepID=UPI002247B790|nr:grasp-with-spasm system ATP-grasp peptide maturase [Aquimarina sp. ERC-38]UZO82067.1 grasp-with-spasm system ATP-grasp peptide maturase [Aquimarina sp. ERC-38]